MATLRTIRDRFETVASGLLAFLRDSEGAFLDAGSSLGELERRSRGVLEGARRAVALGSLEGEDPAQLLDRELVRLDLYLRHSRETSGADCEALPRLVAPLEGILHARAELESIAPTLRMLGMNTRIENARSGAQNGGMETVANEVRRLADLVEPRFRGIFARTATLLEASARAQAGAQAFLERQVAWSERLVADTRASLKALGALAQTETALATEAASGAEGLARDVAAVLVSIQGHDAARQMIEHAVEELRGFEAELAATGDAGPEGAARWLARAAALCRVLPAQIGGARQELTRVLEGISGGLRSAAALVSALSARTSDLTAPGEGSPAAQVTRGVEQATATLRDHLSHSAATTATMRSVHETVQRMAADVRDVQDVGSAVKLIALNALVETARAGDRGRVLAVLANAMGDLASDVVQRTGAVSRSLEEVTAVAGGLAGGASAAQAADGAAVAAALTSLGARLTGFHARLTPETDALRTAASAVRDEVERLVARAAEAIGVAARLGEHEVTLGEVAEAIGGDEPGSDPGGGYDRYTMEAERTIHDRALGAQRRSAATPAHDPTGLGANVELF